MMLRLILIFALCMKCFILINGAGYAKDLSFHERYLEDIQRLARLEEGQKVIIAQFEAVDKRFEAVDKRFEAVDKRFEAVDKRFDSLIREMNQRFEALDKRIELIDNHVSNLDSYFLAILGAIIALMAYIIWDRKTAFDKVLKKIEQLFHSHVEDFHYSQPVLSQVAPEEKSDNELSDKLGSIKFQNNAMTIPRSILEQFQNVVSFMSQFPETRKCMQAIA
jgi:predicted nuclease with TOPRIM domain